MTIDIYCLKINSPHIKSSLAAQLKFSKYYDGAGTSTRYLDVNVLVVRIRSMFWLDASIHTNTKHRVIRTIFAAEYFCEPVPIMHSSF